MLIAELRINSTPIGCVKIHNTCDLRDAKALYAVYLANGTNQPMRRGTRTVYVWHVRRDGAYVLLKKALEALDEAGILTCAPVAATQAAEENPRGDPD